MDQQALYERALKLRETRDQLEAAAGEHARLDAAVECVRVQQAEVQLEVEAIDADVAKEEAIAAALANNVPSYVLKEDMPAYVSKRSALIAQIVAMHRVVQQYEVVGREKRCALAAEASTMNTLEAARTSEADHGNGLLQARNRLTEQLAKEEGLLDAANKERERVDKRLAAAEKDAANAKRVLEARRVELVRAKASLASSLELVAAQKANTSAKHRQVLRDAEHAAEQQEWIAQLTAENARLQAMVDRRRGAAGAGAAGQADDVAAAHPQPHAAPALLERFEALNGRLLQQMTKSVLKLEEEYLHRKPEGTPNS